MRKLNRFVVVFTLLSVLLLSAFGSVAAQDTAPAAATVQCDSDLILNLYMADRFFGFTRVRDQLAAGGADTTTWVDLNTINKGQFTPWFDSAIMMDTTGAVGGTDASGVGVTSTLGLDENQLSTVSSALMMDDASRQSMMDSAAAGMGIDTTTLTPLNPPTIAAEPPECAQLRTELNRFFSTVAFQDFSGALATTDGMTLPETAAGALPADTMSWTTALSGATEIPGPGDPDGTGSASVSIDSANSQVCYTLFVQNLTLPAQAAHIHRGAAGEPGDVVVPFDIAPDASGNATSCVAADPAVLAEIVQNPSGFYVNVHTSDFPDGAVRGQVIGP